jgi:hypothetical protein
MTPLITLALLLGLLVGLPESSSAQTERKLKLQALTVGSGDTPISSGMSVAAHFAPPDESQFLEVMVQSDSGWVAYGPQYTAGPVSGRALATVGHMTGVPWVGPLLTASIPLGRARLTATQWVTMMGWKPHSYEKPVGRDQLIPGYFGGAGLRFGPITVSYYVNKYIADPWNTLPGISYNGNIHKAFAISSSMTWNSNTSRPMFFLGATWQPQ